MLLGLMSIPGVHPDTDTNPNVVKSEKEQDRGRRQLSNAGLVGGP